MYDGAFSGRLKPGMGLAAKALAEAGIEVLDEETPDLEERLSAERQRHAPQMRTGQTQQDRAFLK